MAHDGVIFHLAHLSLSAYISLMTDPITIDINLLVLLWEVTLAVITAVAFLGMWLFRRQLSQTQVINQVEKRVVCMEERLNNVPTKAAVARIAGDVRSLSQLLQRIERCIERIDHAVKDSQSS